MTYIIEGYYKGGSQMCIRNTLILEDKYDEVSINEAVEEYGRKFKMVNNPIILSQLPKNEKWFESANTNCDCNTGIGSYELFTRDVECLVEQLEDKSLVEEVRSEEAKRKAMYKKDVDEWELLIKDLIRKYNFKRVGVLIHFTDSELSTTDFSILDKVEVKYSDINSEILMKIKNDIIYYFVDKN
jgi:hypothetical protein